MNDISDNVDRYFSELPSSIRYSEPSIDFETEKLKDVSADDLRLIIFLIQRTISDMKSVGRTGRGYSLTPYELRRRGFVVDPKELLDLLKKF